MPRWVGLLGSWALLVLAIALVGYAVAAEALTLSDARKLHRIETIDRMVQNQLKAQLDALSKEMSRTSSQVTHLQSEVQSTDKQLEDLHDSSFVITVSTAENRVYARRNGQLVFEGICSTGKNTILRTGGETKVFRTPIGRFRIREKETNPIWVPPDWHYIEEAREYGLRVRNLKPGECLADLCARGREVYSGDYPIGRGQLLIRNGTVLIPPVGSTARQFEGILGTHRLNLGDGYALHGTNKPETIGRAVSHGCVRLRNEDIAKLHEIVQIGTPVYIY